MFVMISETGSWSQFESAGSAKPGAKIQDEIDYRLYLLFGCEKGLRGWDCMQMGSHCRAATRGQFCWQVTAVFGLAMLI